MIRVGDRVRFVETHVLCDDDDCNCSGCDEVTGTVAWIGECGFCFTRRQGTPILLGVPGQPVVNLTSCFCILKIKQDRTRWYHWIPWMRTHKVRVGGVEKLGVLDLLAEI